MACSEHESVHEVIRILIGQIGNFDFFWASSVAEVKVKVEVENKVGQGHYGLQLRL